MNQLYEKFLSKKGTKDMSQVTRRELFPGVWLRTVHTNKFKSSYLSLTLMAPLDRGTAGANALIPSVLRRGTAVHPDMESLSAALDELYGGAIEPVVRKKGETQCVGFVASFLDDAYALKGEKILEPAADLLCELLLKPYTEKGVFSSGYVTGEKANLIDRIRAQINDKRTYAAQRLTREMCRYEAFGVDKLGEKHLTKGEMGEIDGMSVKRVPDSYFPSGVYYLIKHKDATVDPMKLNEANIHQDPPGISGNLLEGRFYHDAFVLGAKAKGVYVSVKAELVAAMPKIMEVNGNVTLSSDTAGAVIRYTTDGSDPRYSGSAKVYAGAFAKPAGQLVRAVARKDGEYASPVSEMQF